MTAEELARSIGEGPSCACGCIDCGRNIYDLYRIAMDQAAWIRELERRIAAKQPKTFDVALEPEEMKL